MDRTHNPEFTMVELYVAYKDYFWMMETTENLLEKIASDLNGTSKVILGDNTIDFKAPYKRISILDSIKEHTGIEISGFDEKQMFETAKNFCVDVDKTMGTGKLIDEIFSAKCEHHYVQPTFITDYPKEMSPLTKEHRDNPRLTERFELLVNGKELANAYSELNDPIDQLSRFEEQLKLSEKGDDEAMFIDNDFIRALEYGMPPTSGIGIGIDRLVMLFTDNKSIQEVIFFPQMKPEVSKPKPKKEGFIKIGVDEKWIEHIMELYSSIENLLSEKPTQVHQKLNGYRKKNKLTINPLQLEDVEKWFD
jgi:lysyl-tRNA synthetase class 2